MHWNAMFSYEIRRFCVKFSRLNALQSSAAPSTSTEAVIDDPTKTSPGDSHVPASVSESMICLLLFIWYYLIIFGWFLPVLYESALQKCSQKSNAPALECYFSCPHLFWTRCPFVVVGISEQWTDTSKYDPGTRPKPLGSLSKEQQASAATIWSHLMHDWLRDDTRIFESQISKYCSCKNTTLLITSA